MPDLGEKIKEATIKQWHVKVGDVVEEFQPIADVSTDKLFTQIPSNYSGKIHKIFHEVDSICQVGELFLEIEVEEEAGAASVASPVAKEAKSQQIEADKQQPSPVASPKTSGTLATPSVRRLAKEKNIDLSKIQGTGKDGRILKQDLESAATPKKAEAPKPVEAKAKAPAPAPVAGKPGKTQVVQMSDFQKGMQKSMTESNSIPHLYLKDEFDLTELTAMREQLKKISPIPITFMSLFIKSFSLALLKYPSLNSLYDKSKPFEYKQYKSHNISLALDSPKGLVVPNIKNVQDLSIIEVSKELQRLKDLGDKGQFGPNELYDGTICLSNIGTIGGTYTGPLILPPQICIVGIGRVIEQPRYDKNMNIVPRRIINMSFGCDHRILDGATVTRFCNQWKTYLENPSAMLIHLK